MFALAERKHELHMNIETTMLPQVEVHDRRRMTTHYEREEAISAELRYTEEKRRNEPGPPVRDCSLWQAGVDRPVSDLNLMSFRQRFGAVSIPAEGIGGVETLPEFRRRGYVRHRGVDALQLPQ